MATLTEISFYGRAVVKWSAVGIVLIALAPFVFRGGKALYLKLNPPPPAAPTVRYGKLPALKFPKNPGEGQPVYKLETISGALPQLGDQGKVYLVGINKSRLLELERMKARAGALGFTAEPIRESDHIYKFVHPRIPAQLIVNLISSGFIYSLDYLGDKIHFEPIILPTIEQAGIEARAFFSTLGALPEDLAKGVVKSEYLIATYSGEMKQSPSYSEANMVRVDLFRANMDELKFVTVGGETSPVNILFSGVADRPKRIVSAQYQYSMTLGNDFATYPLKTADLAWSELTQGLGYFTKYLPAVTVRRAYLAYFESNEPQSFIQPVFVFEGDNGFLGYVQAVDAKYINTP
ncbi:MAG: Uncharacterized protein G01um101416_342 [Microgenomates group bacterium Gr01-1014_16]|nr:MAG: Uncharacterized protein G01um101416_342 [Microgenomates group bacterium Gr01-1014_16]